MKAVLLGIVVLTMSILSSASMVFAQTPPAPSAQTTQEFKLGFKALADLIPGVVGVPQEDEHYGANGDSLQKTSKGLMVWRKQDNWTAFTDGSTTWINGPLGVQSRPNADRFSWEGLGTPAPSDSADINLWDRRSIPTAYIAVNDDNTIYLWSGEPVAYLVGVHVYGFNGVHLGWFENGIVWDWEGVALGFGKQAPYVAQNNEPPKAAKQPKPVKQPQEPIPPSPPRTLGVYTELLGTMLRWGIAP